MASSFSDLGSQDSSPGGDALPKAYTHEVKEERPILIYISMKGVYGH
jgi:hypothetical protein